MPAHIRKVGGIGGLGDITGGKVIVSVLRRESNTALRQTTLGPYDHIRFEVDGRSYYLQLLTLRDKLIGMDSAEMLITTEPRLLKDKPLPRSAKKSTE